MMRSTQQDPSRTIPMLAAIALIALIVAAELNALGVRVNVTPHDNTFFMKPLVRELAAALTKDHKG